MQEGQILFTLDRRPLEAALREAESNLEGDLALAANARAQASRYEDLSRRGIHVSFGVPEAQLPELRRHLAAGSVRVAARSPEDTGPPAIGRLTFVDNAVDQTTGTIRLKGTFANEDRRLWPGQFVDVALTLATESNAIVVPTVAVQAGPEGHHVFVVTANQTVDLRAVKVVRTIGTETMIERGLTAGETVITDGHIRLVPGSRISVKAETAQRVAP